MEYTNRYVAFIDILGFKALVSQSKNDPEIRKKLDRIMKYIANVHHENYSRDLPNIGKEVSVFSDSIVISWDGNVGGGGFQVLMDLIFICNDLLNEGILVRGGVVYGELIHDHDGARCFGPAMVAAYELESKHAKYPRILIDESVIEADLRNPGLANTLEYEMEYLENIMSSGNDKRLYLNFLSQRFEFNSPEEYDYYIFQVRDFIISMLKKTYGNRRIFAKYRWLRIYFNKTVRKVYGPPGDIKIPAVKSLVCTEACTSNDTE